MYHRDLNNIPVACVSKLSDCGGFPPWSLLPPTTSKLLNPVMVYCSLDPVIVHDVVKSIRLKGGYHYTSNSSQFLSGVGNEQQTRRVLQLQYHIHHVSTVPGETAVVWRKPMSKQHSAASTDVCALRMATWRCLICNITLLLHCTQTFALDLGVILSTRNN